MKGIFLLLTLWTAAVVAQPESGFALSEHLAAGNEIRLQFTVDSPGEQGTLLHLTNGAAITYGNILSLGDLFGMVGKPITSPATPEAREQAFLDAFNYLASRKKSNSEISKLNQVIAEELQVLEEATRLGERAQDVYLRLGNEVGRKINCITGGGCSIYSWWTIPGRYLKLAKENSDHFAPQAIEAYLAGHRVALQQAVKAHQTDSHTDLELAYAMEAYASHFLSDNFAAGHLRTPRLALKNTVKPSAVGSLLANYMHNEENAAGLHVHDSFGNYWTVYGDFLYFNPESETNRLMLVRALQLSADEVFKAYSQGGFETSDSLTAYIPIPNDSISKIREDIVPLFYWDEERKTLFRRKHLLDKHDHRWTSSWWGWSTFLALKRHYGISEEMQGWANAENNQAATVRRQKT